MPRCTCHHTTDVHADACPYYVELLVRLRLRQLQKEK